MAKANDAVLLAKALESITIQELTDLSEEETVRLALAFEGFVDKISEVVRKALNNNRRMLN